ncbi:HIT domain-containing protein [Candidatus Parcubacteria bacterium]|nr:HIT domain-containing protein [Candidatus Parcubacteria bacterium]
MKPDEPECIFCRIAAHEVPKTFRHEDDVLMVFDDIRPSAPVHLLIVPKRHISSVIDFGAAERDLAGELILAANRAAADAGIRDGYKLVFNAGRKGGQIIEHVHLHLLGGWGEGEK